ncbi:hypothetical protein PFISCL1PPCAC_25451, partial [Pristionchus fissidentatus]
FTCKESGVTTNGTEFDIIVLNKHVRHIFTADRMFCSFILERKQNISDLSAVKTISSYFDARTVDIDSKTAVKFGISDKNYNMNPKWNEPQWYYNGS